MSTFGRLYHEGSRGPKPQEGRPEMFFIGYDEKDDFNVFCSANGKQTFRSIEKMRPEEIEKFAYKAQEPQAKLKLKQLMKQYDNEDLETKSEHELSQWL